jgi:hypothetical protein
MSHTVADYMHHLLLLSHVLCKYLHRGFTAANHPDVVAGRCSESAVRGEFLEAFECGADVEGHVSEREFTQVHYQHYNYCIALYNTHWQCCCPTVAPIFA